MKERPILMSAPMVLACLRDVNPKTNTRRVVKDLVDGASYHGLDRDGLHLFVKGHHYGKAACPYGVPGDRLWVREAFSGPHYLDHAPPRDWRGHWIEGENPPIWYWAGGNPPDGDWSRPKPSIHMPRWASRLVLEVTDVKVERLHDISEADAIAEGLSWVAPGMWSVVPSLPIIGADPREVYRGLWDYINGKPTPGKPDVSWAANPWVWSVHFRRVTP